MLSRILALFGSCSNRTSWLSTVSRLSLVSVRNSRNRSSMKQALGRTGARLRHAFQSVASFSAKRLILVEQLEKNGLNKEIRRPHGIKAARKSLVNHVCSGSGNDHRIALGRQHDLKSAGLRQ